MIEDIKLVLLQRASEKLIKILDINRLLQFILDIAKEGVDADRGTVYVVDHNKKEIWSKVVLGENLKEIRLPIGKGIAGYVAETGSTLNVEDAYKSDLFDKNTDKHTGYKTESILCMPIINSENKIIGVFQMLNKKQGKFTEEDEGFLRSLSNYSAIALELATLHEELMEKRKIEYELSIARRIQMGLLPSFVPEINGYEVFGTNISCEAVSGDYYDFYNIGEDRWLFVIGDVSGKGIPASLMMATLQSHLKALMKSFQVTLPQVMALLNEYIKEHSIYEKYITLFLGILDTQNHTFTYVNAGHNPPVFIPREENDIYLLKKSGPIVGLLRSTSYAENQITLSQGDIIFCYTDGVTEHMDKSGEEFGIERLCRFLKNNNDKNLKDIFDNMIFELKRFSATDSFQDDLTVMMLRKE